MLFSISTQILRQTVSLLILLVVIAAPGIFLAQGAGSPVVTLKKCWEHRVEAPALNALASDNIKVFTGTGSGSIQAIGARTGDIVWTSELGGEIVSNFVLSETSLFAISNPLTAKESGTNGSILRSISKETGITNWTVRLPSSEHFF